MAKRPGRPKKSEKDTESVRTAKNGKKNNDNQDSKGRFVTGNKAAKGNTVTKQLSKYNKILLEIAGEKVNNRCINCFALYSSVNITGKGNVKCPICEHEFNKNEDDTTYIKAFCHHMIGLFFAGDTTAGKWLGDKWTGKAKQEVTIEGGENPIQVENVIPVSALKKLPVETRKEILAAMEDK
jgi:phage FluMu protein Com